MQLEIRPRVEERGPGGNVSLGVFIQCLDGT